MDKSEKKGTYEDLYCIKTLWMLNYNTKFKIQFL